jgi:hypothetical protein
LVPLKCRPHKEFQDGRTEEGKERKLAPKVGSFKPHQSIRVWNNVIAENENPVRSDYGTGVKLKVCAQD